MRRRAVVAITLVTGCAEHPEPRGPYLPEVYVDYRADREDAILERRYLNMPWIPVCASPCRRTVRPDFEYRVGGEWIVPSQPFRLYEPKTIVARAGSRPTKSIGIVGISVGIPMIVVGGILAMVGYGANYDRSGDRNYGGPPWELGAVIAGLGGLFTIGGAYAVGSNNTVVEFRDR